MPRIIRSQSTPAWPAAADDDSSEEELHDHGPTSSTTVTPSANHVPRRPSVDLGVFEFADEPTTASSAPAHRPLLRPSQLQQKRSQSVALQRTNEEEEEETRPFVVLKTPVKAAPPPALLATPDRISCLSPPHRLTSANADSTSCSSSPANTLTQSPLFATSSIAERPLIRVISDAPDTPRTVPDAAAGAEEPGEIAPPRSRPSSRAALSRPSSTCSRSHHLSKAQELASQLLQRTLANADVVTAVGAPAAAAASAGADELMMDVEMAQLDSMPALHTGATGCVHAEALFCDEDYSCIDADLSARRRSDARVEAEKATGRSRVGPTEKLHSVTVATTKQPHVQEQQQTMPMTPTAMGKEAPSSQQRQHSNVSTPPVTPLRHKVTASRHVVPSSTDKRQQVKQQQHAVSDVPMSSLSFLSLPTLNPAAASTSPTMLTCAEWKSLASTPSRGVPASFSATRIISSSFVARRSAPASTLTADSPASRFSEFVKLRKERASQHQQEEEGWASGSGGSGRGSRRAGTSLVLSGTTETVATIGKKRTTTNSAAPTAATDRPAVKTARKELFPGSSGVDKAAHAFAPKMPSMAFQEDECEDDPAASAFLSQPNKRRRSHAPTTSGGGGQITAPISSLSSLAPVSCSSAPSTPFKQLPPSAASAVAPAASASSSTCMWPASKTTRPRVDPAHAPPGAPSSPFSVASLEQHRAALHRLHTPERLRAYALALLDQIETTMHDVSWTSDELEQA